MKPMRKVLIALAALFAVYLLVSVFLPSEINVVRERKISGDKSALFGLVNDLKKWDLWSPWNKMDKDWQVTYSTPSEGMSSSFEWTSNKSGLGKGKITIVNTSGTESIALDLFMEGRGHSDATFYFEQLDTVVNVKWEMKAQIGFMGRIFPGLFMKSKLEEYFDQGLAAMDSIAHTSLALPAEGIAGIVSLEKKNVLCITDSCAERDIAFKISNMYSVIQGNIGSESKIVGAPLCILHGGSANNIVFEAALSVDKLPAKINDAKIKTVQISLPKVVLYNYYGSVSDIKLAYGKIAQYLSEKGLVQNGNSMEEYLSDAGKERDPAKWLTKIYVPVN